MHRLAIIVSLTSGFALMGYHGSPPTIIATSLAIDASLAPLTAIIASRRGRSALLWTILGFLFGMWTLAYVLLARSHHGRTTTPSEPPFPPTSDAA